MEELKPLEQNSKSVRLLKSEKEAMLARIMADAPKSVLSPYGFLRSRSVFLYIGMLALIMAISTPLTFAAQKSIPGDFLYGLEVGLVETIEEALVFGPDKKMVYYDSRMVERIEEMKTVSSEKKELLARDKEVEKDISAANRKFRNHAVKSRENKKEIAVDEKKEINDLVHDVALVSAYEDVLVRVDENIDLEDIGDLKNETKDELAIKIAIYAGLTDETALREEIITKIELSGGYDEGSDMVSVNTEERKEERAEDANEDINDGQSDEFSLMSRVEPVELPEGILGMEETVTKEDDNEYMRSDELEIDGGRKTDEIINEKKISENSQDKKEDKIERAKSALEKGELTEAYSIMTEVEVDNAKDDYLVGSR